MTWLASTRSGMGAASAPREHGNKHSLHDIASGTD
jgi:hypothetical protein